MDYNKRLSELKAAAVDAGRSAFYRHAIAETHEPLRRLIQWSGAIATGATALLVANLSDLQLLLGNYGTLWVLWCWLSSILLALAALGILNLTVPTARAMEKSMEEIVGSHGEYQRHAKILETEAAQHGVKLSIEIPENEVKSALLKPVGRFGRRVFLRRMRKNKAQNPTDHLGIVWAALLRAQLYAALHTLGFASGLIVAVFNIAAM